MSWNLLGIITLLLIIYSDFKLYHFNKTPFYFHERNLFSCYTLTKKNDNKIKNIDLIVLSSRFFN